MEDKRCSKKEGFSGKRRSKGTVNCDNVYVRWHTKGYEVIQRQIDGERWQNRYFVRYYGKQKIYSVLLDFENVFTYKRYYEFYTCGGLK